MKIKKEINKIELPKNLHEKSQAGVLKAKSEMTKPRRKWPLIAIPTIVVALTLFLLTIIDSNGGMRDIDIADEEISSSIAILRIGNTDYVYDSNLNSTHYTVGDKIGEVKTKLQEDTLPEEDFSSNFLEAGTSIYHVVEDKNIILAKGKGENEYKVFTKSSKGNFNEN